MRRYEKIWYDRIGSPSKSYHGNFGPFWNHTFELLEVVNLVQNSLFMGGLHDGDPLKSMIMLEL